MASTSSSTAPQEPRLSTEAYLAKHQLNELLEVIGKDQQGSSSGCVT
jgi:hypothetical protein